MASTQNWQGLGGGGLRIMFKIVEDLYEKPGYVVEVDTEQTLKDDPVSSPYTQGKEAKEEDNDKLTPYLQSENGAADIYLTGSDTNTTILSELRDEHDHINDITQGRGNYFKTIVKGVTGSGTGATPEQMVDIIESNPEVKEKILEIIPENVGLYVPVFSLDGGSGNGTFRKVLDFMDKDGEMERRNSMPSQTIPVAIAPHEIDQREAESHRVSENMVKTLELVESRLDSAGSLSSCILVDNDAAALNTMCNNFRYTLDELKSIKDPILIEKNFRELIKNAGTEIVPYEQANQAIRESLFPFFIMNMEGPHGVEFGKSGGGGYEISDYSRFFDNYTIPSFLEIPTRRHADELLPNYRVEDFADEARFLTFYTFLASCAPMHGPDINNIKVFIWTDQNNKIDNEVKSQIRSQLAEIGINRNKVTVDSVKGLTDPKHTMKIWTYTGVDNAAELMKNKFE
ncbi:hypothetical protein [Halostella salina]|uniref:hypothetical protein n=1 Tax=Halostella salina TaxID=1547897 RepID=UPI0013CEB104|nr:hypothetical protein [Halostella salina]